MKNQRNSINLSHRYSEKISGERILILGPIPPPLGGVSVHIERVAHKLSLQGNQVRVFSTTVEYRYRWFPVYATRLIMHIVQYKPTLIYYHTSYLSNSASELRILKILKKILNFSLVMVEHDCRYLYHRPPSFKKLLNLLTPLLSHHVFIGDKTYASFIENDMKIADSYSIEGAFISPNHEQYDVVMNTYPPSLFDFLALRKPLIAANAFQLSALDGKDIYGFDQLIAVAPQLHEQWPNMGIIFVLAQIGDQTLYDTMLRAIEHANLLHNIYILQGNYELWPLLKHVDVFVRPSRSDGASVSIQEALHFGTPVVASDVCARPDGSILYTLDNMENLLHAIHDAFK